MTIRKRMIELLSESPMDGRELSGRLGIREKEVYRHLEHVRRSVAREGRKLAVTPAQCLACGYAFKDRSRLTPPGRCPRCRHTRLSYPVYGIG